MMNRSVTESRPGQGHSELDAADPTPQALLGVDLNSDELDRLFDDPDGADPTRSSAGGRDGGQGGSGAKPTGWAPLLPTAGKTTATSPALSTPKDAAPGTGRPLLPTPFDGDLTVKTPLAAFSDAPHDPTAVFPARPPRPEDAAETPNNAAPEPADSDVTIKTSVDSSPEPADHHRTTRAATAALPPMPPRPEDAAKTPNNATPAPTDSDVTVKTSVDPSPEPADHHRKTKAPTAAFPALPPLPAASSRRASAPPPLAQDTAKDAKNAALPGPHVADRGPAAASPPSPRAAPNTPTNGQPVAVHHKRPEPAGQPRTGTAPLPVRQLLPRTPSSPPRRTGKPRGAPPPGAVILPSPGAAESPSTDEQHPTRDAAASAKPTKAPHQPKRELGETDHDRSPTDITPPAATSATAADPADTPDDAVILLTHPRRERADPRWADQPLVPDRPDAAEGTHEHTLQVRLPVERRRLTLLWVALAYLAGLATGVLPLVLPRGVDHSAPTLAAQAGTTAPAAHQPAPSAEQKGPVTAPLTDTTDGNAADTTDGNAADTTDGNAADTTAATEPKEATAQPSGHTPAAARASGIQAARAIRPCLPTRKVRSYKLSTYLSTTGRVRRVFITGAATLDPATVRCVRQQLTGATLPLALPRTGFVGWRLAFGGPEPKVQVTQPARLRTGRL